MPPSALGRPRPVAESAGTPARETKHPGAARGGTGVLAGGLLCSVAQPPTVPIVIATPLLVTAPNRFGNDRSNANDCE